MSVLLLIMHEEAYADTNFLLLETGDRILLETGDRVQEE